MSDHADFDVVVSAVNDAPVASKVPKQTVDEDATVTYPVPVFTDEDDDTTIAPFAYEAKLVVNGSEEDIPPGSWIKFVEATRTFTFEPLGADVGSHTLRVTGTDAGGLSDFVDFKVTVKEVNDAPKKPAGGLTNPADPVLEDTDFAYVFPKFTDEEDDTDLEYVVKRVVVDQGGVKSLSDLPGWIKLEAVKGDATKLQLTFAPEDSSDAGTYKVRVTATDKGIGNDDTTKKSAEDAFDVEVSAVNDPPEAPTAALAN